MLTTNSNARTMLLKKCCLVPLIAISVLLFSKKSMAQNLANIVVSQQKEVATQQDDSKKELQVAFDKILGNYIKPNKMNSTSLWMNFSDADNEQLLAIYQKMSKSQQSRQKIRYGTMGPVEKKIPAKDEFEKWKNAKVYGVWLDGKRINNDELDNYTNTDFSLYLKSGLAKNAKHYGQYTYHLELYTNKAYEAFNEKMSKTWWPNVTNK